MVVIKNGMGAISESDMVVITEDDLKGIFICHNQAAVGFITRLVRILISYF